MSPAELRALQDALAAEQAASFGYGVLGAHLSGAEQRQARADWVAHQVARDQLTAMITAAGWKPVPSAVSYQLPVAVHSAATARALAIDIENRVTQEYIALVAVTSPSVREFAARQTRATALRAVAWSGNPQAFPGLRVD